MWSDEEANTPLQARKGGCENHVLCRETRQIYVYIYIIISSPEPSGSQGELIVYPCSVVRPSVVRPSVRPSVVRRPPFSKIFSSETAWPIKAKFYMKHLWEGGTNVYINNPGHVTKMAAMPIYGKNLQKSSSPEPLDRFQPNLA